MKIGWEIKNYKNVDIDDTESTIYNILIKAVTHIRTVEAVQRDTELIMEVLNAKR